MNAPAWLVEAYKYEGVREIPGVNHHPLIVSWWKAIKRGGIKSDEVPWCAAFVGAMLEAVDIVSSRYESARSYLAWGRALAKPAVGCVVILERVGGGGHVGFVVGKTQDGCLLVLGGNQNDEVNVRAFKASRAIGYRWPTAMPLPTYFGLPILTAAGRSTSEA